MFKEFLKFICIIIFVSFIVFGTSHIIKNQNLFSVYDFGIIPPEYDQMRKHIEYCPVNKPLNSSYRSDDIFYPDDDCHYYSTISFKKHHPETYDKCMKSLEIYKERKAKGYCDRVINEKFYYKTAEWDMNFSPRYKTKYVSACSAVNSPDCDEAKEYIEKQLKIKYGF